MSQKELVTSVAGIKEENVRRAANREIDVPLTYSTLT